MLGKICDTLSQFRSPPTGERSDSSLDNEMRQPIIFKRQSNLPQGIQSLERNFNLPCYIAQDIYAYLNAKKQGNEAQLSIPITFTNRAGGTT